MDKQELVAKAIFEECSKRGLMHGVWADLKVPEYDGQEMWLEMADAAITAMENWLCVGPGDDDV